jgi:hypothetical protein
MVTGKTIMEPKGSLLCSQAVSALKQINQFHGVTPYLRRVLVLSALVPVISTTVCFISRNNDNFIRTKY